LKRFFLKSLKEKVGLVFFIIANSLYVKRFGITDLASLLCIPKCFFFESER